MKVLLATIEYPPFKGGVARYYESVYNYWPENDNIIILNNNDNRLVDDKKLFFNWRPSFKAISDEISNKRIGHVLVGQLLPLGTVVWLLSFFKKIDYSVFIHGMDIEFAKKKIRKRWLAKRVLKKSKKIICNSRRVAELVVELSKKLSEKVIVVNPGISERTPKNNDRIKRLREKYQLQDKIILFSVSRLVKRKGFDMVIKSLPQALKEAPNLVYIIAGIGHDEDYLKELAQKKLKPSQVIFLGSISEEDKWAWLDLCDIFIMPSRNIKGDVEGFGIVYLEANLAGKPIIAGDSGGVRDVVENEVNGLLVNSEKIESIKNAIIRLAQNKNLRLNLGKAGQEKLINNFKWKDQVEKIYKIINNTE